MRFQITVDSSHVDAESIVLAKAGELATELLGSPTIDAAVTVTDGEGAELSAWRTEDPTCAECGADIVINDDGTTNHCLDGDEIDHEADADHVAIDHRAYGA